MRQLKISKTITNRESESLERYLREISRVDLITAEEEVILAKRIRAGDLCALEKLTRANLRFVVSVAKQYQNQGLPLTDLINEGNLGLIKAGERFDETRGFKFISYAVWWIRQSILQAISESRMVRLPMNKISSLHKIHKAFTQLEQEFERETIPEELAVILNVDLEEVQANLGIGRRHVSMDAPFAAGEQNSLIDILENPNAEAADRDVTFCESLRREVDRSLATLSPRQKEIVKLYFGIGIDHALTVEDIAMKFDLTRERVRQIKDKALARLQTTSKCKLLKGFLGY
ncbi:MAG: RNA polymerase sigma factor RpoD/SigA [Bacteroidota bacterium]